MSDSQKPIDIDNLDYDLESTFESLKQKSIHDVLWSQLTNEEIACLRHKIRYDAGLNPDVADKLDRLPLIICLLNHCENRDGWIEKYRELKSKYDQLMQQALLMREALEEIYDDTKAEHGIHESEIKPWDSSSLGNAKGALEQFDEFMRGEK